MRDAYLNLKSNAKRRGKVFELTFDQFREFASQCQYIKKKGRTANSYHIDRIDETKGYTIDNIQLLTNIENIQKRYDHQVQKTYTMKVQAYDNKDLPF